VLHKNLVVGPLQCNCAILACEKTREAVLIDPGDEAPRIIAELSAQNLTVKYLLHTHAHFDHVGATAGVKESQGGIVCVHKDDEQLFRNLPMQGRMFGFPMDAAPPIEKFLEDEEILTFGEHRLQVLHTPGHSPGGICLRLLDGDEKVFSGDTLFQQSIGRTDLWGGNLELLLGSIRRRLFVLNDDTPVFPGHGPDTTIGVEKRTNPFLS